MLWAAFITIPGFLSAKSPTAFANIFFTRRGVAFARSSAELAKSDLAGAALDLHAQATRCRRPAPISGFSPSRQSGTFPGTVNSCAHTAPEAQRRRQGHEAPVQDRASAAGSELSRQVPVDLEADADLNEGRRCPGHWSFP
jgi:hypothetical protein